MRERKKTSLRFKERSVNRPYTTLFIHALLKLGGPDNETNQQPF